MELGDAGASANGVAVADRMPRRTRTTRLAIGVWSAAVVLLAASGVSGWLNRDLARVEGESLVLAVVFTLVALAYASLGGVIAARRARNPVGWILLAFGTVLAVGMASDAYAVHALMAHPGSLPAGPLAAWLADFVISGPGILFGAFVYVFLLFPDGRLHGMSWRAVAWAAGAVSVALQLLVTLRPGPLPGFPSVTNPLGVPAVADLAWLETAVFVALLALLVAAGASSVLRFRRARGEARLQLKWFATAAAFLVLSIATAPLWWLSASTLSELLWAAQFALGLTLIPAACAVAILRYRLYDIDRLISRTVSYGLLTGLLAGVYGAGVVLFGRVFAPATMSSDLAVAVATLGTAAVFAPARRRIQRFVDGRFNRARYDAQREVEAFRGRLRDEVDLEQVGGDLVRVAARTVQPARVSLSLTTAPAAPPR